MERSFRFRTPIEPRPDKGVIVRKTSAPRENSRDSGEKQPMNSPPLCSFLSDRIVLAIGNFNSIAVGNLHIETDIATGHFKHIDLCDDRPLGLSLQSIECFNRGYSTRAR